MVDGVGRARAYFQPVAQLNQFGVVFGFDHDGMPGIVVVIEIDQSVAARL
ncbi:MAG: hypothetical protein RR983_14500 [Massilia sp.]